MSQLRVKTFSKFSSDLIKSFFYLVSTGVDGIAEDRGEIVVEGPDPMLGIGEALELVGELIDNERLPLTGNDKTSKHYERILECVGSPRDAPSSDLFVKASKNLSNVVECGDVEPLALMKTEFYEESRTPHFRGKVKGKVDVLGTILTFAGYVTWRLGRSSREGFSVVVTPLTPWTMGSGIGDVIVNYKRNKVKLPESAGIPWAFSLWLAVHLPLDSPVMVYHVKEGQRISVSGGYFSDLKRIREGLNKTFTGNWENYLEDVLRYSLSKDSPKEAITFVQKLYETVNGALRKEELAFRGLRDYAGLIARESGKENEVVRAIGRLASLISVE